MSWEKTTIGKHCEITSSKRIFFSDYTDHGIPFFRSKEIIEMVQHKDISESLFISQEKYDEITCKFGVPSAGDLLLTSVGTIGIPYIIKESDHFYFKDGNLTWFRNFDTGLLSAFLYYWFLSDEGIGVLNNSTIGSSQKALTISNIKKIQIPLFPLNIQSKIVSILSAYDSLIENNQKQIKLLEEAAQRLYKEWFVDLRFPGWENTKIVDGVPEGWTCTKLGKILKTFSGSTPSRQNNEYYQDGSIPWLKTKELNDRFILSTEEKITETALKSTSVHIIEKESVIMAMYGATIGKLGISTSALTCNQACCVFDLTVSPLTNEFLFSWLYHKKPYLISLGKGAAQPNLSQEFIQSIDIILPPSIFIEEYTRLTHPFFQSIKNNQEKIEHLSILRNQLLKNLLH